MVINGKAFPYTERLELQQGDSTRFRVLNTLPAFHPMHLHGFYYRVVARGSTRRQLAIPWSCRRPCWSSSAASRCGSRS